MNDQYNLAQYEDLVKAQHARFPSLALPPEYAELFQINTLQVLIKLSRYKFVARMLKKQDDALEVGSGTGIGTMFLSQHVSHVTGLEIRKHEFEAASAVTANMKNVTFCLQSLFDHDLSRQYDSVVSLDVIEHFSESDGHRFAARIAQHCKSTGIAIIGTPSIHSLPYQSKYSRAAHIKCYDQHELVALMDNYFARTLAFSMNDELVHTGNPKLAWYYFVIGVMPRPTAT
jgi:2-polyprenyl-3-methyl-5-hydroxy-6-metoxy-1,4-benzoquinol methylase